MKVCKCGKQHEARTLLCKGCYSRNWHQERGFRRCSVRLDELSFISVKEIAERNGWSVHATLCNLVEWGINSCP